MKILPYYLYVNRACYHLRVSFITIEGGEGVGKTTQVKLLKERFPKIYPDHKFIFTKEPGGTLFADKVRELILSDAAKEVSGKAIFGLFLASRLDHVERIIDPALKNREVVVCDRFAASTYAYQIVAQKTPELLPLYKVHLALLPTPDLTVIFDLDPSVALARIEARRNQQLTHFDAQGLPFHERLRVGFREYATLFASDRAVFIDANRPIEEIHQDVLIAIKSVLT